MVTKTSINELTLLLALNGCTRCSRFLRGIHAIYCASDFTHCCTTSLKDIREKFQYADSIFSSVLVNQTHIVKLRAEKRRSTYVIHNNPNWVNLRGKTPPTSNAPSVTVQITIQHNENTKDMAARSTTIKCMSCQVAKGVNPQTTATFSHHSATVIIWRMEYRARL